MARFNLRDPKGRIEAQAAAEMLSYAEPTFVLGSSAERKRMKAHNSDTIIFRQWLPIGADEADPDPAKPRGANQDRWDVNPVDHLVVEGVTPSTIGIEPRDVSVQARQYAVLMSYTDVSLDLYEDDFVRVMRQRVGETMGYIKEMLDYATLRAGTAAFYIGGMARSGVNNTITDNVLRQASMFLARNGGRKLKPAIIDTKAGNDSSNVEAAYCVYCHTDLELSLRLLSGFIHVSQYARRKAISMDEFGSSANFRFILSKELEPYEAATSANVDAKFYGGPNKGDVYPVLIIAKEAWAEVDIMDVGSVGRVTELAPNDLDKSDPLGQLGYVGVKGYIQPFVQHDGWMARVECLALNGSVAP